MPQLPDFKSDEEAVVWFDTHDTATFIDSMEEITQPFNVMRTTFPTKPVDVRLRADYLDAIRQVAERKGIPYQMLVQSWLMEKLKQEAPDLLSV